MAQFPTLPLPPWKPDYITNLSLPDHNSSITTDDYGRETRRVLPALDAPPWEPGQLRLAEFLMGQGLSLDFQYSALDGEDVATLISFYQTVYPKGGFTLPDNLIWDDPIWKAIQGLLVECVWYFREPMGISTYVRNLYQTTIGLRAVRQYIDAGPSPLLYAVSEYSLAGSTNIPESVQWRQISGMALQIEDPTQLNTRVWSSEFFNSQSGPIIFRLESTINPAIFDEVEFRTRPSSTHQPFSSRSERCETSLPGMEVPPRLYIDFKPPSPSGLEPGNSVGVYWSGVGPTKPSSIWVSWELPPSTAMRPYLTEMVWEQNLGGQFSPMASYGPQAVRRLEMTLRQDYQVRAFYRVNGVVTSRVSERLLIHPDHLIATQVIAGLERIAFSAQAEYDYVQVALTLERKEVADPYTEALKVIQEYAPIQVVLSSRVLTHPDPFPEALKVAQSYAFQVEDISGGVIG